MMIAAGAIACAKVLDSAAIHRKNMDMVRVHTNVNNKNVKKASGVRRRFVKKYKTKSKVMVVKILFGKSHNIDATASAKGW